MVLRRGNDILSGKSGKKAFLIMAVALAAVVILCYTGFMEIADVKKSKNCGAPPGIGKRRAERLFFWRVCGYE